MTYDSLESSTHAGEPVELYRFALGDSVWRYTSARDAITYSAENYAPAPIRRSEIEQTQEFGRAILSLEATIDLDVVQSLVLTPPDGVLSLTVFRRHLSDTDNQFITWWKGRVVSVVFGSITAQMRCEPIFTTLKRSGRRANYQINCRHPLYHGGCGVNALDYKTVGVVLSIAGLDVTAAAFLPKPAGWFVGGRLMAAGAQRMITASSGGGVTLSAPIPGLKVGDALDAYPGCDHTLATCAAKFGNSLNYGGFPFIPLKNPFAGDAIV
jgi:uncharacterized phage protein (TIGR02218 family)